MHRQRTSKAPSKSIEDEFDLHFNRLCAGEGRNVISERTPRAPQAGRQRTRDRSDDGTAKMVTKNMLSKQPSAPVVNTERVEARYNMSNSAYFSTSRASERLTSLPTTPPKKPRSYDPPPSTTRAIRTGMDTLGLSTPSKKGKEISGLRSDSGPKRTIVIDDEDDDEDENEMNEVINYFSGFESPPSPESASPLIASQRSRSTTTSSSWSSASTHHESSSWDSIEIPQAATAGRKRARPSDAFDIEVTGTNSASIDRNMPDVFSAPRISKARKEDRESSPKKSSLEAKPITVPVPNDIPPLITSFFRDDGLSRALRPHAIAYDHQAQQMMDSLSLAWGVQYELARGVTNGFWTWEDVRRVLHQKPAELRGSNAVAAPKVPKVMLRRGNVNDTNAALWKELDREQAAIVENKGRGLGLMGSWHGEDDWFGGQVQQVARLKGKDSRYVICLDPMEKRRSHRFSRFCGSRRILQLRIDKDHILKEGPSLKRFLQQKFILCGRIFVPFHVKDHSLYMVETNEDWKRKPLAEAGDNYRLSFSEFINWHNPPEYNSQQALSKYVTRYALGLSTSVPTLEFEAQNIFLIDDIYGSEYQGGRKASADETMTDGCGFINQAALRAINSQLNKRSLPVAIQGRIAGAKGLWILHPDDTSPDFKIWIRESQNKIKYTQLHRAHRIFELVATSQPSNPLSVTTQPIVNLAYNGVPHETLLGWLEKGLIEEIQPLIDWDRPHSAHLWRAIYKAGSLGRSRLARMTVGFSRAKGLTKGSWKDDEIEQILDVDSFDDASNTFGGRNQYSGAPFAINEFALELFQAGFHPRQSTILRDKLNFIIEQEIKRCVEKYAISLPESLSGFVIPDPLGILNEGEVYYRSSESLLDPRTQLTYDTVTGDVILGRYPIRLASDLQKVKAVNVPELYRWPDVIIVSTKGARSLASLLSGGDMDGDTLFMLRELDIVEPFRNYPFVPPPDDLYKANFKQHIETVGQFCERRKDEPPAVQQEKFQSALLLTLNEDCKGLYSKFHDYAIEKYGYNHPKAIRLAYIFNTLLDASKSGLILADGIFKQDKREYGGNYDMEPSISAGQKIIKQNNTRPAVGPTSDAFILTQLKKTAEATGNKLRDKFKTNSSSCADRMDKDLIIPYEMATEFANKHYPKYPEFAADLQIIREHVFKAHEEYLKVQSKNKRTAAYVTGARTFAEPVAGLVFTTKDQAEELKASFAYTEYHNKSDFPFQLAFQKLCEIKARSTSSGIVACTREIDEMRAIPGSHIRVVEKSYHFEDSGDD